MVRFVYILLLLAAAAFYPLYEDKLSFITLVTLLILPVFMLIQGAVSCAMLRLKKNLSDEVVYLGCEGEACITLRNNSPFPLSNTGVRVRIDFMPTGAVRYVSADVPLPAHSSQTISVNIDAKNCGLALISLEHVVTHDLMGLFSFRRFRRNGICGKVYIVPKISDKYADEAVNMLSREGELQDADPDICRNDTNGTPGDVCGFREFAPGDKLSRMHYKLSARFDKDIVKILSVNSSSRFLLSADLSLSRSDDNEPDLSARDRVLEKLLSCAYFLYENDAEVYVAVPESCPDMSIKLAGGGAVRYTGPDSFETIARAVAGADFVGTSSGQGYICCEIGADNTGEVE